MSAVLHVLISDENFRDSTMLPSTEMVWLYLLQKELPQLGTIKASQVVVLNEDSVVVTQRKLM